DRHADPEGAFAASFPKNAEGQVLYGKAVIGRVGGGDPAFKGGIVRFVQVRHVRVFPVVLVLLAVPAITPPRERTGVLPRAPVRSHRGRRYDQTALLRALRSSRCFRWC